MSEPRTRNGDLLERLALDVADTLGHGPGPVERRAQRNTVVRALESQGRKRARRPRNLAWWLGGAGLVLAGSAAVALVSTRPRPADLEPKIASAPVTFPLPPTMDDEWLRAPENGPLALGLGEDGQMKLHPGARGRMQRVGPARTRLIVENGRLDVDLRATSVRQFAFHAGAYRVQVCGTAFRMEYRPGTDDVDVKVERGRLTVAGGQLGADTVTIEAGQRFSASRSGIRLEPWAAEDAEPAAETAAAETLPTEDAPAKAAVKMREERTKASARSREADEWRVRYASGDFRGALAAAERAGLPHLLATGRAPVLLDLADAARLSGDHGQARTALESLRRRWPNATEARTAAFLLGRIDADARADFRSASLWFERYLREAPRGAYAAEAEGRSIVAYEKSGQTARARAAAKRYLERHPHGPYRDLARSLVEPTTPSSDR